ncbi:MAG: TIR domain-containing protein [Sphingorhabdus sp.]
MAEANDAGNASGGQESTIFLSYSRSDQKRALPIIKLLDNAGYAVWWDGMLEPGERFSQITENALNRAKAVVVLWSQNSTQSHWVHDEATQGRDRRCLVPISLDGSEAPLGFRQFQLINVSKAKANGPEHQAILRAVAALHDKAPMPLQPAAAASPAFNRRWLLGGGTALVGGAIVAWATGLIGGKSISATSVAVLPFANLSGDPRQSYFSDGLAAELRSELSRNQLLQVAAQASSNMFRDRSADAKTISGKLRVAYLVDGNVRLAKDRVKVSVELVNGKTGVSDWQDSFEGPLSDIFALQSDLTTKIASQLSAEIDPGREKEDRKKTGGTESVAAYDAFLRAKDLYDAGIDEPNDRQALAKFEEAISEDSAYAAAHAGRSRALAVIANLYAKGAERPRLYREAVAAARRAVDLAPDFAEAHSALGFALAYGQLDMKAARLPYQKSQQLGKGDADILSRYAVFMSRLGKFDIASDTILQSSALDPLNARTFRSIGDINFAARRYAEAIAAFEEALALNPKLAGARASIGFAQMLQGDLAAAAASFAAEPSRLRRATGVAMLAGRRGDMAAAEKQLAIVVAEAGDNSNYQVAQVQAQWGNADKALIALQAARKANDGGLATMGTDPLLDPVRKAPEFTNLLKSVGLV